MSATTSAPKIFVLVPSYNHATFVERSLRSIFNQTLPPAKLLVIDDGSNDDSTNVVRRVLADCPFPAELIARENLGLCATLNEGFTRSAGCEFFAYLGSDDVWLPRFLERRAEQLRAAPQAVLAFGNAFLIDENDRVIEATADWGTYQPDNDRKMLLSGFAPISSSVFYRRAALEQTGWNEDARLEDFEFYLKLSAIGKFAFDPETHAAWRQHGYNTSRDIQFMRREVLSALRRNAAILQIDARQLKSVEPKINLTYAEVFVQRGLKKECWELTLKNWRAAKNPALTLRILAKLLVPRVVIEARRERRRQRFAKRFGRLEV